MMRAPLSFGFGSRQLRHFISVAGRKCRFALLLVRYAPLYVLFGLLKRVTSLHRLARWTWRSPTGFRNRDSETRAISALIRLSQIAGISDRDCLQRSLLLYRVLSRSGADPTLVVGFRRGESEILGHAWVVVAGRPVIRPEGEELGYSPAFKFGQQGELLRNTPP
jgi:hypothetical protein